MEEHDFHRIVTNLDAAWKLVSISSHEEISALVSNNETRVSDVMGESPREVILALGDEFVPRRQLAEFRGMTGENNGKTVFEISGAFDFLMEFLWEDLLGEVRKADSSGPVTVALRETLRRMRGEDMTRLLERLDFYVTWRMKGGSCGNQREKPQEVESAVPEGGAPDLGGGVMDWVTLGMEWNLNFTPDHLETLPVLLRYFANVDPTHLTALLEHNKHELSHYYGFMSVLDSLVIVSHDDDANLFPRISAFLRKHLDVISPEWISLVGVFLGATRQQVAEASSHSVAGDVSVGGVALNLIAQQQPKITLKKSTWRFILNDVFSKARCCELPAFLQEFRRQLKDNAELLREVLVSRDVCWDLWSRFQLGTPSERNEDVRVTCGMSHALSFYFSVFGLNCDWMLLDNGIQKNWTRLQSIPVQIANALRRNPPWVHLLPQFQQMLRSSLPENVSVGEVAWLFSYETQREWEELLNLVDGETLPPMKPLDDKTSCNIPSDGAAPFIRALIKLYGVEWTKERLTGQFWTYIDPASKASSLSTFASLGSLLHSAIQLEELKEVERRAWPGLLPWRSAEGKTALEVATEQHDEFHPIRLHIEKLTLKLPTAPVLKLSDSFEQ